MRHLAAKADVSSMKTQLPCRNKVNCTSDMVIVCMGYYLIDDQPVLEPVLMEACCSSETSRSCPYDQHAYLHIKA